MSWYAVEGCWAGGEVCVNWKMRFAGDGSPDELSAKVQPSGNMQRKGVAAMLSVEPSWAGCAGA